MIRLVETLEGPAIGSMMRPTRPMDDSFRLRSAWRHSATSQHKPATWTHKRTALWEVYPHDGHPHRGAIRHIRKLPESGTGEDLCTFLLAAPSPGQCSIDPKTDSAGRPPSWWHEPAARTISEKNTGDRHENRSASGYPLPSTPPLGVHVKNFKTRFQVAPQNALEGAPERHLLSSEYPAAYD